MIWSFSKFHYGFSTKHLIVLTKPVLTESRLSVPWPVYFILLLVSSTGLLKRVFHGEQCYPIITITPAEQYKNMTVKGQIYCNIWILDCYLNFQPLSKKALFYFSLDSHDMDTRAGTYSLWEIRLISHLFTICPPSHNWKTCYSLLY